MKGGKNAHPLSSRIKKLMQTDEDVGKIAAATPNLIGTQRCSAFVAGTYDRTQTPGTSPAVR